MSAVYKVETVVVQRPAGIEVPEYESYDSRLVHAIANHEGPSIFAVESVAASDSHVTFTWVCVTLPLMVGHERSLCRFLSERLVESWSTISS